ncbi:hypothetical protein H5410_040983 [Solanum commersonii]|uniref:Uncharacterized protein n=1 Tax=Solanum commersonii TaxID=4109 RepID=A0A9J5XRQ7_SOLCO|nr:hypothetical protein H5410_040983 [Solanum commersonii]
MNSYEEPENGRGEQQNNVAHELNKDDEHDMNKFSIADGYHFSNNINQNNVENLKNKHSFKRSIIR